MTSFDALKLAPGEVVFVDSFHDGVARLVIGAEGERVETVPADQLPEDTEAGAYLKIRSDGACERDRTCEEASSGEMDALMREAFGETS